MTWDELRQRLVEIIEEIDIQYSFFYADDFNGQTVPPDEELIQELEDILGQIKRWGQNGG